MNSRKKLIIGALVTTLALGGVLFGAMAVSADSEDAAAGGETLMARVAAKLGISQESLENAFQEATREMMEERQNARLDRMVEEGVMTEDEANEFRAWWDARPDMGEEFGRFGGIDGMRGMAPRGRLAGAQGFGGECPTADTTA